MTPADFDALTERLFTGCDDMLGDTLTITPPGAGAEAITCKAHVTFADDAAVFSGATASQRQDIAVDLDKALVEGQPGAGWRIAFARLPGKTFEPIDVQNDASGLRWVFNVKTVPGG